MKRAMVMLLLAVTACSSSSAAGRPARQVVVGWADRGHTVRLHPDDSLVVKLDSTYWRFRPVSTDGVLSKGRASVHAKMHAYPGSGSGTVVVSYHALHSGTATITAGRFSCGEALRCVGAEGSYRLTVVVS
ncbi:MAG TPA: hypothetical protein VGH43_04135 [Jatrophihabitans sp.]|jgi:hypothetical protein